MIVRNDRGSELPHYFSQGSRSIGKSLWNVAYSSALIFEEKGPSVREGTFPARLL